MRIGFSGRILMLGCGGVAQCTLPLLLKHLEMPFERLTILDKADNRQLIAPALQAGAQYVRDEIKRDRFGWQLEQFVGRGDMIIDLACDIGCADLLEWCHKHGVLYLNTSVELWDPPEPDEASVRDRTLYARQMALRPLIASWKEQPGTTAILEHGANPGLISHFTKQAILDIAGRILQEERRDARRDALEQAMSRGAFNRLAQLIGVKVIHVSERDTQTSLRPKERDEFVNTWSVEGFHEEATAPAEMGWGTHEHKLPEDAHRHHDDGPRNQICLDRFGMDTFVRSCVPSGEIQGMVVRHGEAFSISEALTVYDENGKPIYRPTVHYAYHPCDAALESLGELRDRHYELQPRHRIMRDEIVSGWDELGCLLMGHDLRTWWAGTILDINEARQLVPGQNATTLQVAAAVLAAVCWMIRNPEAGVRLPDQLPHDEIMEVARPYLGRVISKQLDWSPDGHNDEDLASHDDAWQFGRFLLSEMPQNLTPSQ